MKGNALPLNSRCLRGRGDASMVSFEWVGTSEVWSLGWFF